MSSQVEDQVVCFRFLEDNEYHKLEEIFTENDGTLPLPSLSRIAVAEIEPTKEIIGFFVFQLIPHAEPMWIHPSHRRSNIWLKLVEMIAPLANKKATYITATSDEVVRMCEALGLRRIDSPVYIKEVDQNSNEV